MFRRTKRQVNLYIPAAVVDDAALSFAVEVIELVSKGDRDGWVAKGKEIGSRFSLRRQQILQMYLLFLLELKVWDTLGQRTPAEEDLRALVWEIAPRYVAMTTMPPDLAARTLLLVFEMAQGNERLDGQRGEVFISVFACLGILMDDPRSEMDAYYPYLRDWCVTHAEDIDDVASS